jgi:hypothetical protein
MLRAIIKDIDSVQPNGESLITYRTVDFESAELQEYLSETYRSRQVVGVEVLAQSSSLAAASPTPLRDADDDVPF